MDSMFSSCHETGNVEDMCFMFSECKSLKELNISNFVFNDNCSMFGMFLGLSNCFKKK